MKIIARQNKHFLCTVSEYEVCKLMGFTSLYDAGWEEIKRIYKKSSSYDAELGLEGVEIDITQVCKKAETLRSKEKDVENAIKTFRGMADALETAWPSLVAITDAESGK